MSKIKTSQAVLTLLLGGAAALAACTNGTTVPYDQSGPPEPVDAGAGTAPVDAGVSTIDAATTAASDGSTTTAASDGAAASCPWTPYSTGLSGGSIGDVVFDNRAQPPVAYATSGSSIFKSTDGGKTWQTQGTSLTGIGRLALPGTTPNVLLATSYRGVIQSTDSGKTWSVIGLDGLGIDSIAVAPSQPLRVYAGTYGGGVFRSSDGGVTWVAVDENYPFIDTTILDVASDDPDDVVAGGLTINAENGLTPFGLLVRSTTAGQQWTTVIPEDVAGTISNVRRCPLDPTLLYAATAGGALRSTDRGATWTTPSATGPAVRDVGISPNDCDDVFEMVYFNGTLGPHQSTDGAQTFGPALDTGLSPTVPTTSPGWLVFDPADANGVLIGTHDGVWFTTDDGNQWAQGAGILGLQVRALSASPTDPSRLWLASWGSGVWDRPSADVSWSRLASTTLPDFNFNVAADPFTANRVLVGGWSDLFESTDATTFTDQGVSQNEFGFAFDPSNPSVVYAVTQLNGVYKSINGGGTWTASNNGLTAFLQQLGTPVVDVEAIAIDPTAPQTIYIGTNGQGIYKSTNGAQSWTNVVNDSKSIVSLLAVESVTPGLPAIIYASGNTGVQKSTDGGTTWSDVSEGLPAINSNAIALDPETGNLYVSDGPGIFVKHGDSAWTGFDLGCTPGGAANLPTVLVQGGRRMLAVSALGGVFTHPI